MSMYALDGMEEFGDAVSAMDVLAIIVSAEWDSSAMSFLRWTFRQ